MSGHWTTPPTTGPDLTHLKTLGPYAADPVLTTTYPVETLPVINGSTFLLSILPDIANGITFVSVTINHLDPAGNSVYKTTYPGVWSRSLDGPTVIKCQAQASQIRLTVIVASTATTTTRLSGSFTGTPTGAIIQAYSSPNPMVPSARVIRSLDSASFPDSVLYNTFQLPILAGVTDNTALRSFAGTVFVNADFQPGAGGTVTSRIELYNAANTLLATIPILNGFSTFGLPALQARLRTTANVANATISMSITAEHHTT